MITYVRGTVVVVRLDPREGAEKKGTRPCLVVQNDRGNESSPLTIVVPFTDRRNIRRMYPFLVAVSAREGGLELDSVVDCGQIMTIDRGRIVQVRGVVTERTMKEVDDALRVSLSL
ncbi:MAG: type II toxin-antitoxin system PemK/MazF family toxin [Vicinamibacterales bacterium]